MFDSLAKVLRNTNTNFRVFFRDDDGGWADQRLKSLANCFVQQELPLDVAVIPVALTEESTATIESILTSGRALIHMHQHGYAHINHQKEGRSCEFGGDRNRDEQQHDIASGQKILSATFGELVEPIFTPPWNRCTADTTSALKSLGFSVFSRIEGSDPIESELLELPVAIDWLKKRKGVRLDAAQMSRYICRAFESGSGVVGVMLHHEHMDRSNRETLIELMTVLKNAPNVQFNSMIEITNRRRNQT